MNKTYKKNEEHEIQKACLVWLQYQYPKLRTLVFAIPNGENRTIWEAKQKKDEGMKSGVADLFLPVANNVANGLFIEVKTKIGRQSETQKNFEIDCIENNYQYAIVRGVDEFIMLIDNYFR